MKRGEQRCSRARHPIPITQTCRRSRILRPVGKIADVRLRQSARMEYSIHLSDFRHHLMQEKVVPRRSIHVRRSIVNPRGEVCHDACEQTMKVSGIVPEARSELSETPNQLRPIACQCRRTIRSRRAVHQSDSQQQTSKQTNNETQKHSPRIFNQQKHGDCPRVFSMTVLTRFTPAFRPQETHVGSGFVSLTPKDWGISKPGECHHERDGNV